MGMIAPSDNDMGMVERAGENSDQTADPTRYPAYPETIKGAAVAHGARRGLFAPAFVVFLRFQIQISIPHAVTHAVFLD